MFLINTPYASSGLKVTYNKQLVIYEGTITSNFFQSTSIHTKKSRSWAKRDNRQIFSHYRMASLSNLTQYHRNSCLIFSTFDEAYIAKCLLIVKMRDQYLLAIEALKARLGRNIPNIDIDLTDLSSRYPEYFI